MHPSAQARLYPVRADTRILGREPGREARLPAKPGRAGTRRLPLPDSPAFMHAGVIDNWVKIATNTSMDLLATKYGDLGPYDHLETGPGGEVLSIIPAGLFALDTPLGKLTPQHSTDDMRRPKIEPLTFHPDGTLRSIALEERTEIPTPIGPMLAELVNFYPCGSLRRVFPLNGKLSGYWTEKEEADLSGPLTIETPAGSFTARIVGLQFFPDGRMRSVTLWPGETVELDTPAGRHKVRIGVSFYKDGSLRSFEPARPITVATPLGRLEAFDPDALGIHGDLGSLVFHQDGSVAALATPANTVEVSLPDGMTRLFSPDKTPSICDENAFTVLPLRIRFHPGTVVFGEEEPESFPLEGTAFTLGRLPMAPLFAIEYACGA